MRVPSSVKKRPMFAVIGGIGSSVMILEILNMLGSSVERYRFLVFLWRLWLQRALLNSRVRIFLGAGDAFAPSELRM